MSNEKEEGKGSFWSTVPGVLTGCAALVTAIGGLITILITLGVISGPRSPTSQLLTSAPPSSDASPTATSAVLPVEMPVLTNKTFVNDKVEGTYPDFSALAVNYNAELVHITIAVFGMDKLADNETILLYLYGTYIDEIDADAISFTLRRDNDSNGHFEELMYSGPIEMSGSSISMDIPIEYLPDISTKKIWGYLMQSQDRIPDEGELLFPTPS